MNAKILLIDDEDVFRNDIALLLRQEGHECRTASDGAVGIQIAEEFVPDIVLCDLVMPHMSGIDALHRLCASNPDCKVIMLTAYGSMETAIEAFRKGAVDYLVKPIVPEDLLHRIDRCMIERQIQREVRYLRLEVLEATTGTTIVGTNPEIMKVKKLIEMAAPTDSNVLITGESGTGKELVARALHDLRFGNEGPFVAVNCAALSRELIESELFGHVRGAFTGAHREKPGHIELASGGTLFLDEICEMPLDLQPKLLRVIDSREVFRVGATRSYRTNARIVAATNRRIHEEVMEGRFREDLYYRLAVVVVSLPPLRDRVEDIPSIVDRLIHRLNAKLKRRIKGADSNVIRALMAAPWKGNVRELENALERAMIFCSSDVLRVTDLPGDLVGDLTPHPDSDSLRQAVHAFEREHIRRVLEASGENREEAARRLEIDPSTLYRRLKEFGSR